MDISGRAMILPSPCSNQHLQGVAIEVSYDEGYFWALTSSPLPLRVQAEALSSWTSRVSGQGPRRGHSHGGHQLLLCDPEQFAALLWPSVSLLFQEGHELWWPQGHVQFRPPTS